MQVTKLMGPQAREMPLCSLQFGQLQVRLSYLDYPNNKKGRHPTTRSFSLPNPYLSSQPPCHQPSIINHQPICLGQLLHLLRRFRKGTKIHRRLMPRGAQLGGGRTHLGHLAGAKHGRRMSYMTCFEVRTFKGKKKDI